MADEAGKAVDFARSDGQVTALALTDRLVETERRLAAILAMDVVGYSRMVEADEDLALARLRWLRESLLEPQIAGHRGRIFKTMGDGLLAEFASASDAIGAAVDIQRVLTTATLDGGMCGPLQVRIGIHIGDVVSDGADVLGDGVNVAARLEGIAQPGTIYVSRIVRDSVRRTVFDFEDLGERHVKNISRPIQVLRVRAAGIRAIAAEPARRRRSWRIAPALMAAAVPLMLAIAGGATWLGNRPSSPAAAPAPWSAEDMRQTFAVLPLAETGDDPDLRRYADGVASDLSALFTPDFGGERLLPMNSGAAKPHFLIDIKVRRSGSDGLATITLSDAAARDQLLSRMLTEPLGQPLDPQRGGIMQLGDDLKWAATEREQHASDAKPPAARDARDLIILSKFARQSESGIRRRVALVQEAARLAPDDPNVLVETATILSWGQANGLGQDQQTELNQARADAERVLTRAPDQMAALRALANVYIAESRQEDVLAATDRMLAVAHNDRWALAEQCFALLKLGRGADAAAVLERVLPLDSSFFVAGLATVVRFDQARYGEAANWARKALLTLPDGAQSQYDRAGWLLYLASAEALGERPDAAARALADFQALRPAIRGTGDLVKSDLLAFPGIARNRLIEGLRKAGMKA